MFDIIASVLTGGATGILGSLIGTVGRFLEKKQKLKEVNPFDLYTRPGTPNGESDPKQDAMGKGFGKEGSVKKSTSPNIAPPVRGKTVKVSTPPKKNNPNVSSEPK